jgi:hypothetical protein
MAVWWWCSAGGSGSVRGCADGDTGWGQAMSRERALTIKSLAHSAVLLILSCSFVGHMVSGNLTVLVVGVVLSILILGGTAWLSFVGDDRDAD